MSKVAPRNATIRFLGNGRNCSCVLKQYHATYTAKDEVDAYRSVDLLLERDSRVRMAQIYNLDESNNSLWIEFIPGKTLYEIAKQGDVAELMRWLDELVSLFVSARKCGTHFDADPSNFLINSATGELVIVDPVCQNSELQDFACVVFVWGLMKLIFRNAKFWMYPSIIRTIHAYLGRYMQQTDSDLKSLNRQMASYIETVIGWNREVSESDTYIMILLRRCVAIPIYTVLKWLFAADLIFGRPLPQRLSKSANT